LTEAARESRIQRNQGKYQPLHPPALRSSPQNTPLDQFAWEGEPGPKRRLDMMSIVRNLWHDDQGQDIAEYAVMLAVILVIVVGTIRLVGSNANNTFSSVGSAIQ
jgi:Flp pilus assembly pilin Flp